MATSDSQKRARTALRIAQVKFQHALKRDESAQHAPRVSLESSTGFCDSIDAVLQRNTTDNVQTCKKWIVNYIAPSTIRVEVLGEYLVAVSKSIAVEQPAKSAKAARNRIDLLLVVNDVLHAEKYHRTDGSAPANIAASLKSYIVQLAELAAQAVPGKDSTLGQKLKSIINFWAATNCISADDFTALRECVDDGLAVAEGATPQRRRIYALPDWFGDRTVPWSELSASYMLEPLARNPDRAIPVGAINVMRFEKRQPSERVQKLLENYFENIDLDYRPTADNPTGETKKYKLWLDQMGQLVKQNKETGETATVGNGYGWSTKFCQEMKEKGLPESVAKLREEFKDAPAEEVKKSRWSSPPRNHGRDSRTPDRRYSYSSRSRSRSPSRSRSRSRSRSHSRSRSRSRSDFDNRSRSRSSSYDKQDRNSRPKSGGRQHRSSRNQEKTFDDRRGKFEDRGRQPPDNYSRKRTHDRQDQWKDGGMGPSDTNKDSRQNFQQHSQQRNFNAPMSYPSQGPPQTFPPSTAQQPRGMSGFVQPPPAGQFQGYQPQGFPLPHPLPQQFHGGVAPPPPAPPPNFQGQFYGANPNAGGFQNNSYQFGGQPSNYQNNPNGYSGQGQGNFRGGYQGGQRGGHRGGYRGQGRGQGRY